MSIWPGRQKPKSQATVASILLREVRLPDTNALFAPHALWWPEAEQPHDISCEQNIVQFHIQDAEGSLVLMDFPEPDLFARARSGDLDASQDILQIARENKALVMAALSSMHLNAVERAIRLTRWVTSVAEACNALAINWGAAAVLTPREDFCKLARAMDSEFLPLPLWIRFSSERQRDGSSTLSTRGMREFGHWEIQAHGATAEETELFNYAGSLALFLITENPKVRDGDTIGFSDKDRIRVKHAKAQDASGRVYQFEIAK